jgi:outer membrane protein assembly factor BamB
MRTSLLAATLAIVTAAVAVAADWPQWRNADRSAVSKETGLLREWPEGGPALRWKATDIGTGYSSPSVVDGKVFLQTTDGNKESALCLDEKTGEKVWKSEIGKVGVNRGPQYPGTRATPAIAGDLVYCLASDGTLACLTTDKGQMKWKKDLVGDFGGRAGNWAYSESVLVDGDLVICTPGGDSAALAALNRKTGEVVWKSELPEGDTADCASIVVSEGGGVKQYVQFLRKGVVGVDAKTGKFLWRYTKTSDMGANILTPIVLGDRVFTATSRTGGGLVELKADGAGVTAKEIYYDRAVTPGIGGAVLLDGYVYGTTSQALFCADFATGKVKWKERSVGAASLCAADGLLFVRGHGTGEVALVEASPEAYKEKGRLKQPDRSRVQAWSHPVVANGGLYLRDQGVLLCYEVGKKK